MRATQSPYQHTLNGSFTLEGVGLHTGEHGVLRVSPAPPDTGRYFVRLDLPDQPCIQAHVSNARSMMRSTVLAVGEAVVSTTEHLLAALSALGVDNARLELNGPEIPILDGSSRPFLDAVLQLGLQQQPALRFPLRLREPIVYEEPQRGVRLEARPAPEFSAQVTIAFEHSTVLAEQSAELARLDHFAQEVGACRTFCFAQDLLPMHQAGLIRGGNLDNAIVIADPPPTEQQWPRIQELFQQDRLEVTPGGYLSNLSLYFDNEPARHKLLDVLGDLALLDRPLQLAVSALRPGHAANVAFAQKLFDLTTQNRRNMAQPEEGYLFDVRQIQQMLPHRYPFLLVDRILKMDDNSIQGVKNVTFNEPFFPGHFEGNPIMPGVLQLEAMAQVGGVLLHHVVEDPHKYWVYYLAVDKARFKKPVVPGDQLILHLNMVSLKRKICKMEAQAFVAGALVSEAEIVASLVPKE